MTRLRHKTNTTKRSGHGYFVFVGPLSDQPDKVCYARWSYSDHIVFDTIPLANIEQQLPNYWKHRGQNRWPILVKAHIKKIWHYDSNGKKTHYDVQLEIAPPDMTCNVVNSMIRHNMMAHTIKPYTLDQIKNLEFM